MLKTTANGMTTIPRIENEQDVVIVEELIIVYQHGDLGVMCSRSKITCSSRCSYPWN
jgi:hypothetical protein